MKVYTITLNPAFDVYAKTSDFCAEKECLADIIRRDSGGKGINTSRALSVLGVENTAFLLVGEENKDEFIKELKGYNLDFRYVTVSGRIRENITLKSQGKKETRISFRGFYADKKSLDQLFSLLFENDLKDSYVTLSGSLPVGISAEDVLPYLKKAKDCGARIIIDSKNFTKADILSLAPFMIKPNEEEISLYTEGSSDDIDSALRSAKSLQNQGIDNVIITLGPRGGVLANDRGVFSARPPKISVKSTVGAGDSTVAGFIYAVINNETGFDALKTALSVGTAACMSEGSEPPRKEIIKEVRENIC